jgi:hypothetical protein
MFTERYLKAGVWGAVSGAIILVIIIIQVERQIILSVHKNKALYFFRGVIALMMALIGSIIIDQIIFKEDIEQQRILLLDEKVNKAYEGKSFVLKEQIKSIDSAITSKEAARKDLVKDITENPTIKVISTSQVPVVLQNSEKRDTATVTTQRVALSKTISQTSIPNPKIGMLPGVDGQIQNLNEVKFAKDSLLLTLRADLEKEVKSKVGFLDELKLMMTILVDSWVALAVWLIWLIFLLCIELFILMSKTMEKESDYDVTVRHQMDLQLRKLKLLANAGSS